MFNFFKRQPKPAPVQSASIRWLPLPCPCHGCTLIPEECGPSGEYRFYCPLCRLASQPLQKVETEPLAFPEPVRKQTRAGGWMFAGRATKRVEAKLGKQIPPARPRLSDMRTVAELPAIRELRENQRHVG